MWPIVRGCGSSHTGHRPGNEDCFLLDRSLGLFAVADGIGGRAGGEVASEAAVDVIHHFFKKSGSDSDLGFDAGRDSGPSIAEGRMNMAFRLAHREVRRRATGSLTGMGTTLSALLLRQDHALLAHVGDSRIYRLRNHRLDQLTSDHSFHSAMLAAGVVSASIRRGKSRFGNLITRAVGMPGDFVPDVRCMALLPGDRYLLCSDGLTDVVDETTIAMVLQDLPVDQAAPMLVATALSSDARDNVTAVVVEAYLPAS